MHRRIHAIPSALLVLALSGCVRPGAQATLPIEGGSYVCRVDDNVGTPGPDLRLTVNPDPQRAELLIRLGRADWQALDAARGSSGQVFANAAYAWRGDATGGVLTDIQNIETYRCTSESPAPQERR
jgi:hypothetical protein